MTRVCIKGMESGELDEVLGWAETEGWNPGLDDAAAFHSADPAGFLLALCDGEPVGAISVVNHSDRYAFLGLYICRPDWRGQGIGSMLWKRGLAHGGARTIGLDGVAAQEANYARSGFVRNGATLRFEGRQNGSRRPGVRPALPQDLERIEHLDRAATGVERPRFLSAWVKPSLHRRTLVFEDNQGVQAFATVRACRTGCKIGPIVAPDAAHAMALVASADGPEPWIIDVPEANDAFIRDLRALGYHETFRTARMYRGSHAPGNGWEQAIATMELG
ncbi:GNAT family N-acetyltransferase [Rubellimicrobium rubrum]|uniref:GNAT family N-acetyltransferase n=1 Tax=Rubellimicrobium rubrum TaxID=2585369 RepID=A0A5C4MQ80_9RHOB|nr:GNAT family N-acetyltransferase [Rubellimicrobium rubrum]TNC47476.1 GNAT family N-acetyltransferase [Rubellimicrobium rubrum]